MRSVKTGKNYPRVPSAWTPHWPGRWDERTASVDTLLMHSMIHISHCHCVVCWSPLDPYCLVTWSKIKSPVPASLALSGVSILLFPSALSSGIKFPSSSSPPPRLNCPSTPPHSLHISCRLMRRRLPEEGTIFAGNIQELDWATI